MFKTLPNLDKRCSEPAARQKITTESKGIKKCVQ